MAPSKPESAVLTIRVPAALEKRIRREARRRHQTRSEVARAVLEAGLGDGADFAAEARRQSLLVSKSRSEREILRFITEIADTTGWK